MINSQSPGGQGYQLSSHCSVDGQNFRQLAAEMFHIETEVISWDVWMWHWSMMMIYLWSDIQSSFKQTQEHSGTCVTDTTYARLKPSPARPIGILHTTANVPWEFCTCFGQCLWFIRLYLIVGPVWILGSIPKYSVFGWNIPELDVAVSSLEPQLKCYGARKNVEISNWGRPRGERFGLTSDGVWSDQLCRQPRAWSMEE